MRTVAIPFMRGWNVPDNLYALNPRSLRVVARALTLVPGHRASLLAGGMAWLEDERSAVISSGVAVSGSEVGR